MYDCLAPTGEIRIAVAVGPTKSALWTRIPDGGTDPEGVTVDLARRIGEITGRPVRLVQLESSARIIETANDDIWDLSFTPVDADRRAVVDFGPAYHIGESSYLVRAASPYVKAGDLHRDGTVILGVAGTATIRSAERASAGAQVVAIPTLSEAIARFQTGEGDALALGRLGLDELVVTLPDTRITEGNFHVAETAVAVQKGRPDQLAAAKTLVDAMKTDGTVAASFHRHGMANAVIPTG
ncbi:transporter substrate-binding domain-containing protein [Paracoccus laeviglucosivorans]|uniref:Amino acid ABC transporter substrate-binding protein, PAAT family n=1 Tax=Paracoccus laeviglucosivorans TaxID=1197861 RepID=A0A521FVG9_9RHOB|nr:transporter substrate-binding domain-containing protein [Paracoccus laeviglucosivorans]SMP00167.1 amino acid ABC transporter substrate-binding protein, PAAT family [Paracoccus laeviglucosivorans]